MFQPPSAMAAITAAAASSQPRGEPRRDRASSRLVTVGAAPTEGDAAGVDAGVTALGEVGFGSGPSGVA